MNVDDIVAERIEQARRRMAADRWRRAELAAARERGLQARHAAKLKRPEERAATPWPSLYEYALAHRCPACRAPIGTPCTAPRKQAAAARRNGLRCELGLAPCDTRNEEMHAARHDIGRRHYRRDVGNAPWPEGRIPGQRYDSLDGAA
ncbi:hypothetical protein OHS33_11715 [Streptomyces sp. NBC_00536]|uniref:hypothetical protein n=1 Tax=Streptomyces sp. NBC_00536 TaxID=2975769 RepID=UPI002E821B39|nr:hypothetical protein [Streptomyces sp. NBC_00536]WUC78944.1 hypothetical protein OHS33_11715 [Streptomyces sp. NBC_00536]